MKIVEIVLTAVDPADTDPDTPTRVWGEVKALDESGMPTVAHVEARLTYSDTFHAKSGRHVFVFAVNRKVKVTLNYKVNGAIVGPAATFDCTTITAGWRYTLEVPT